MSEERDRYMRQQQEDHDLLRMRTHPRKPFPDLPKPADGSFLPSEGAIYRHRKSGGYYRVLATGRMEATGDLVTIYQPLDRMMTWVRPTAEFGEKFDYVPNGEIPEEQPR